MPEYPGLAEYSGLCGGEGGWAGGGRRRRSLAAAAVCSGGNKGGRRLQVGGCECVTVGEDGRLNLVTVGEARLDHRRIHDSRGLVSYTAARWASPAEFATGGLGFGLQWWDQRKPGGLVSQLKGDW